MLIEDHFVANVAKRIGGIDRKFGPYHQHHMSIELPKAAVANRKEAIGRFAEICRNYPEPEFYCTLTLVTCRAVHIADSKELLAPA